VVVANAARDKPWHRIFAAVPHFTYREIYSGEQEAILDRVT
jgi:hypothetical protein